MKKLVVAIIAVAVASSLPASCQAEHFQTEENIRTCFRDLIIEGGDLEQISMLQRSLTKDQKPILEQLVSQEIKKLQAMEELIILTKSTCEPVLKWAQNSSHIFVAAKLSHRWDSPPCLKTVREDYHLRNNTLVFINLCLVSNAELKFQLSQRLFGISLGNMDVKKDGVGTYSITLQKASHEIWPYLFDNEQIIPVWEEVMERDKEVQKKFEKKLKDLQAKKSVTAKSDHFFILEHEPFLLHLLVLILCLFSIL